MMQNTLSLTIAGDLAPIRAFAPIAENAPESLYGDVLPEIRKGDVRIVNLESPLDGEAFIVKSGAAFAGKPCHLPLLSCVPFDAATLANNHAFDTGWEGYEKTVALLDKAGIAHCGAGRNREEAEAPLCIRKNGLRLALFNMSEGEDRMGVSRNGWGVADWDVEGLCRRIQAARASGQFNAIVAVIHCGLEYYPYPSYYVYEAFQKIAASGVDLVVGHHPHVPQGMVMFGKVPVFFSLGNFIFYQPNHLLHRKTGYIVRASFDEKGLTGVETVPYRIGDSGIRLLTPTEKGAFDKLFAQLSEQLDAPEKARDAWNACLAYYGRQGFADELKRIQDALGGSEPHKGAAMMRNRVECMQHSTQWGDGMTRIADGTIDNAPEKAVAMVRRFFTERKTLVVCDSGLGGMDVASQFFHKSEDQAPEWDVVYVNAWPDVKFGYNGLPSERSQEDVFQSVLEGMKRFNPALCIIACNTLSIVYERLARRYVPDFPVLGIVETAVALMREHLLAHPESHLLILGTKGTVESGVYSKRLAATGIDAARIHSLACPGLATLIEQNPSAPEVRHAIQGIAETARRTLGDGVTSLALGLCCTHFGYAGPCWSEAFADAFGAEPTLLNPNRRLVCQGAGASFSYHSRIPLKPDQQAAMAEFFTETPELSDALRQAHADDALFTLPTIDWEK